MNILDEICICAFAASIIALPFLLVNWVTYMKAQPANRLTAVRSGFPTKSVGFFVVPILIAGVASSILTTRARHDAVNFIQGLPGNYTVYVDQQEVPDSEKMISALKDITPYWAHHSHPTKRIKVYIRSDERDLILELGRDSSDRQEYWVFYPEYSVTSNTEIGRITTSAFDGY